MQGLHIVDILILFLYAGGMLGLGWFYSRRQRTVDEYFVGNRSMNSYMIGISLYATLLSTITYLSTPGEMISKGPVVIAGWASIPIAYVVIAYGLIPVFMKYRVTSAYEILEMRLGVGARLTGAVMFIALRLIWMSLLIYFASKALLAILDLEDGWLFAVTLGTGVVAITYSTLGGLRAVVVTDMVQFILLFGGAVLVIVMVTVELGGFSWFPTEWDPNWDEQPLFSFDPHVRASVFGFILMGTAWNICTAGADQTVIQRFMATSDAKSARRSFLIKSIAGVVVATLLAFVGLALSGYFQAFPEQLPAGKTIDDADLLFPHFISHQLPPGIAGLVVSGMFAAAMSSIDSGVNSISAVVTTDFVGRFSVGNVSDKLRVRLARIVALTVGLIVVGASTYMQYVPGNFLAMSKRTSSLFVAPLFILFFIGLFVPFRTQVGAIIGSLASAATAILIAFWSEITGLEPVSFMWITFSAFVVGATVGCLASLATSPSRRIEGKQVEG